MIYTDNEHHLCCPVCGGATLVLSAVQVPDDLDGTMLVATCRGCRSTVNVRFVRDGDATRVDSSVADVDRVALARVAEYWLIDPAVPSPRRASDLPAVHNSDIGGAS